MRAIQAAGADAIIEPDWMGPFLASLARDDLAPATLRGYRYDLRHFLAWHRTVQDIDFAVGDLARRTSPWSRFSAVPTTIQRLCTNRRSLMAPTQRCAANHRAATPASKRC